MNRYKGSLGDMGYGWLNASAAGNPFWGIKLLGISIGRRFFWGGGVKLRGGVASISRYTNS